MTLRGNGLPYQSTGSPYVNPLAIFPAVIAVSDISPDILDDTSPTADVPGTPQTDDLVFVHVIASGATTNATFTPPAGEGFASVASGYDTTGTDTRGQVFWKRWGAGDIDNTTVVFTSTNPNARIVISLVRYGDQSSPPTGASLVGSSLAMSTTLIAPTVTVPEHGLLLHFYEAAAATVTLTTAANQQYADSWTAGSDGAMAADAAAAPSGSSQSATATASVSVTNGWCTVSLALEGLVSTPTIDAISAISTNTDSPNATNTIPGSPATDNIVIMHLANVGSISGGDPVFTPPAGEGWQVGPRISSASGSDSTIAIYWKRWGAGFVDNTSVTVAGTSGNTRMVFLLVSGCVTATNPYAAAGAGTQCDDATNDMACTSPTLAVSQDTSLVMRFYSVSAPAPGIFLSPPMRQKYGGVDYSFNNGSNGAMALSSLIRASAGTAPLRSAATSASTANGWVGITVAVGPRV